MARLAKQPIPIKVYRHFAVVTLAATAVLAIFSDGENSQAIGDTIEEHREDAALRRESEARFANAPDNVAPVAASFADEAPAARPAFGPRPSSGAALPSDPRLAADRLVMQAQAIGFPFEVLARMTPSERTQMLKGLQESGMLTPEQRQRRIAALLAASGSRSGTSAASTAADLR